MASNLTKKCRGCLAEEPRMHNIFDLLTDDLTLAKILSETISTQIKESDEIPSYLCPKCTEIVVNFYEFKEQFIQSQIYVENELRNISKQGSFNDSHTKCIVPKDQDTISDKIIVLEEHEILDSDKILREQQKFEESLETDVEIDNEENLIFTKFVTNNTGDKAQDKSSDTMKLNREIKPEVGEFTVENELVELVESVAFYCKICEKNYLRKDDFLNHMNCEHGEAEVDASKFTKKTLVKLTLGKVKEEQVDTDSDTENDNTQVDRKLCKICDTLVLISEYDNHCEEHKKHFCSCGAKFVRTSELANHKLSKHSDERNYVCQYCDKSFKIKQLLTKVGEHQIELESNDDPSIKEQSLANKNLDIDIQNDYINRVQDNQNLQINKMEADKNQDKSLHVMHNLGDSPENHTNKMGRTVDKNDDKNFEKDGDTPSEVSESEKDDYEVNMDIDHDGETLSELNIDLEDIIKIEDCSLYDIFGETNFDNAGEKQILDQSVEAEVGGEKPKRLKCIKCRYCYQNIHSSNFMRHLERTHRLENEVAPILALPKGSQQRKRALAGLRNKIYFDLFLKGETHPKRKSSKYTMADVVYYPCIYCKGLYDRRYLGRHVKTCSAVKDSKCRERCVKKSQTFAACHMDTTNVISKLQVKEKVFDIMRADEISFEAKKDLLIAHFGDSYLKRHNTDKSNQKCRNLMRELSRLLITYRQLTNHEKDAFKDLLRPINFDVIVTAARILSGYDYSTRTFKYPSLAVHLGSSLKSVSDELISLILKGAAGFTSENETEREKWLEDINNFQTLMDSRWNVEMADAIVKLNRKRRSEVEVDVEFAIENNNADPQDNESCLATEQIKQRTSEYVAKKGNLLRSRRRTRKKRWSDQELSLIKTAFGSYIQNKKYPTTNELKMFCSKSKISRDPFIVKAKIQHLIRSQ